MRHAFARRLLALVVLMWPMLAGAAEPKLSTAGASYAPLDVSKKSQSPALPLSLSQRNELLVEFKGLVHLGLRKTSFEQWGGREMADCDRPEKKETWIYRCEIITGQGNGYYFFYPSENRQSATLQALDIRVHASDENLLDDFRRPVQELFGRASMVEKPIVSARPSSPVRRWSTESDTAELFIDRAVRPEGSVRFVWQRSPLVSSDRVSLLNIPRTTR